MKFSTVFCESDGNVSMRRVLAFILALCGIGAGVFALSVGAVWQVVAVAFGIPVGAALILLFLTSWTDVIALVKAWKSNTPS